ncbi:type IV pilin N-terminal domain-containing protein [Methanoculleus sp. YWC-01]|uniref:Type IV pilin N-terminal domain-containing protein n=1 Tax=Methanoculleus nereidis TaxID=2735141 RepID=A0ABU3Z5I0_9EURY|nr:type IV pilin N-terminal domain-containing protein [Methanoculleus sp. YWC-01]MDV4344096.1 type IV pilin N-terminal domain-containing protein [Methanoculleus sp. YWC-01]
MRQHPGEEGVSEVIGVMLLVGLTVLGVAIVAIVFLSDSQPEEIPRAAIVAGNRSDSFALVHEGGDPLRAGEYRIYVDTGDGLVDRTGEFTGQEDGVWLIGETLVYDGSGTPERVVVTAGSGGSETILAEPDFVGEGETEFSPDPVEPGVTETPTPTPESIVTIDLGEVPANDAEIFATITSNQTEYVHMILYNYDEMPTAGKELPGGRFTALRMTPGEVEDLYTSGKLNINSIGSAGDTIAVVVIAYDENDTPIASLTEMGTLQG